mgnify:FL=1
MGIFSFVKAGGKRFATIKSVQPNVGKSKLKKAVDDVKLSSLKAKGKMKRSFQKMEEDIDPARVKLRQTTQKLIGEPVTKSGVSKGKDMKKFKTPSLNPKPINKAMGGRVGRKFGNPKPKTNIQKIKETFAPKGKNLKPVDKKKNPGLAKLPTKVRNKMGYMKSGGRA